MPIRTGCYKFPNRYLAHLSTEQFALLNGHLSVTRTKKWEQCVRAFVLAAVPRVVAGDLEEEAVAEEVLEDPEDQEDLVDRVDVDREDQVVVVDGRPRKNRNVKSK